MKVNLSRILCLITIILVALSQPNVIYAQTTSTAPSASDITITNNSGKADTVYVANLCGGDKVSVYNAVSAGKLLGYTTISTVKTEATVNITQLGTAAGSVYVSITGKGELESKRTQVDYSAEVQTDSPSSDNIIIVNNAGKADTVNVTGLYGGETIKVYNAATGGKLLASVGAATTKTEVTISITQLGTTAGSIYVSVKRKGELESSRTQAEYEAEPKTDAIDASYATVTNNAGIYDTVNVIYLSIGDVVKVYNAVKGGSLLGSATVAYSKTEATITITQLGTTAGSVYISVTNKGKLESDRIQIDYLAEPKSEVTDAENITVTNNGGASDTVYVANLTASDVVKVYNAASGGTLLGSATVASSKTEATVTILQLGTSAGSVYVSITNKGKFESTRTQADYSAETQSDNIDSDDITVTNNAGASDTVKVINLTASDLVKVYRASSGTTLLGSATVASSKTEATITISQLGTSTGSIYISITSKGKTESSRTKVSYSAEPTSDSIASNDITITNNPSGTSDTIYVTNLTAADVVKVYDSSSGGTLLGSATVASSKTEATVTIKQLGTDEGSVYISVTSAGELASDRIEVEYSAESQSDTLDSDDVTVTNNVSSKADTVEVTNLTAADIVKVYNKVSGGKLLGSATVADYSTYVTISITQLGTTAGSVYVSVTSENEIESTRLKVDYSAEGKSATVSADNIIVTNNAETSDTVQVTGLTSGDIVKVYDSAKGGTQLGTATVSTYGAYATVTISQLGTTSGSVYVSITSTNKTEGDRTQADYTAESSSTAPNSDNIIVTNNAVGISDTVEVTGLTTGDVVKVYDLVKGGTQLGTATVSSGSSATVTITQLGTAAGSIYVSVTSTKKTESDRTSVAYVAEATSTSASSDNIVVTNNSGTSDTVQVTGLSIDDVIKIYDSAKGGTQLGTATVSSGSTVTISIAQLGTAGGSIYVSITSTNKIESDRVQVDYSAEASSDAPSSSNIQITNNVNTSDTVKVTELSEGDIVNVYDLVKAGTLLGTATVDTYGSSVTISITQLGTTAGSVYVSVTNENKLESSRTTASYSAEAQTDALSASKVSVVNNAGTSDTVNVSSLTGGDVINVYDAAMAGNLLGTATVSTYGSSVAISITQLGSSAGSIYITVTSSSKLESNRTQIDYSAESISDAPLASNITLVNNAGIADTVKVTSLSEGDSISVYDSETGGTKLGSATVATYGVSATVTISQLGSTSGSVYVSFTKKNYKESARTKADYSAEPKSSTSSSSNIVVTNNAGVADIVVVKGLSSGDVANVYDSLTGGTLLGTGTVGTYESSVTIKITQIGTTSGTIYVSITSTGKLEGERASATYAAEQQSDAPSANDITITNNAGISDTIEVTYLEEGDLVKVYDAETNGTLLGSDTVDDEDDAEVTIEISQIGSSAGTVYVSITSLKKLESEKTAVNYETEETSDAPDVSNITVVNNYKISDTITVSYLEEDDIVKVYDAETGGTKLGYATVAEDETEATISISQLGTTSGTIYVSVIEYGKKESDRTKVTYSTEAQSTALSSSNVVVKNNALGTSDTVTVSYLDAGDVIKVYTASTGGTQLGTATVADDSTAATVKISQLGTSAGTVYVSVTTSGKKESTRTEISYAQESTSDAPTASNVTIVNNSGQSDTITVAGLDEYDVVKVYSAASSGTLLGSGTVDEDETEVTVKISQLGTSAGTVYISVISTGAYESDRTAASYSAE